MAAADFPRVKMKSFKRSRTSGPKITRRLIRDIKLVLNLICRKTFTSRAEKRFPFGDFVSANFSSSLY